MMICVYCETVSDFPYGFCEECDLYDGIVAYNEDEDYQYQDYDPGNEDYIDSYAEAALFGWDS